MGAQGTSELNFGAVPGTAETTVVITGQATIVAGSEVEAWIRAVATADHPADEHLIQQIKIVAGSIVAGTGFTIYGFAPDPGAHTAERSTAHLLTGRYAVNWAWN